MFICLNATFIFFFPPTLFQTLNIQWGFWTSGLKTQTGTSFKDVVLYLRFLWSTWSLIKTSEFSTTCLAGADSSRARPREAATWCRQWRKRQEGRKARPQSQAQSPHSVWAAHGEGMCALFFWENASVSPPPWVSSCCASHIIPVREQGRGSKVSSGN